MKPKNETTGRSAGQAERALAAAGSPGWKRCEVDRVRDDRRADPEDVRDVVVDRDRRRGEVRRSRAGSTPERRSRPSSGSAERRCQTTGSPSWRASQAAGISGESLKWTSSKRCRRSVRRNCTAWLGRTRARARTGASAGRGRSQAQMCVKPDDGARVDDARPPRGRGRRPGPAGSRRAARTRSWSSSRIRYDSDRTRRRARCGGGRRGLGCAGAEPCRSRRSRRRAYASEPVSWH